MRERCRHVEVAGRRFLVRCVRGVPTRWNEERELLDAGVPLPLCHRAAWLDLSPRAPWLLSARDEHGRCAAVVAFTTTATRAMPGHVVLRAERVGVLRDARAVTAVLAAAARLARARRNILRIEIATFSFDASERRAVTSALAEHGYVRARERRFYRKTARVDLRETESDLLASFHPTARRHIRAVSRHPVTVRPFTDPVLAGRVEALARAARERTGGLAIDRPFDALLRLSALRPDLVHFVGLFRSEELLAFASAHAHGDYATYADAGSARRADIKLPLGYAPAWELMLWAKRQGLHHFDFGGITDACDRLRGISDFKRYFRGEELDVSEEWVFEPHRVRAAVANTLTAAATWWRMRSLPPAERRTAE